VDYLNTMGIPFLAGRGFEAGDEEGEGEPSVVIINEALARRHWGSPENALGQGIRYHQDEFMEIVGVVGDIRHFSYDRAPRPEAYTPYQRDPWPFFSLVVKTQGDPLGMAEPVRRAVTALDPAQPVYDVKTMDAALWESVGQERFSVLLLGLFASLAVVLAVVGVYGLMAYAVTLRIREMGIRVALGAARGQILWLSLRGGIRLTVLGLALGVACALSLTRLMASMLYGVSPWDPGVLVITGAVLTGAVVVAAYLPARRASGTDPASVLRME
jgi:putative ABC transport system permease protein